MKQLIITQKVSYLILFKRKIINLAGKIIYKLYQKYYYNNIGSYTFHESELSVKELEAAVKYVDEGAIVDYKIELI